MKKHVITLFILFQVYNAFAQQVIDPTVEVVKNFEGNALNISKGMLNTTVNDSITNFDLNFNYNFFNSPYKRMYEFAPLPYAQINNKNSMTYPIFMAKIGAGAPAQFNSEFWLAPQISKDNKHSVLINGKYNLFNGYIPLLTTDENSVEISSDKVFAPNKKYGIGAIYQYNWDKGILDFSARYNGGFNTFYGFNAKNLTPEGINNLEDREYLKNPDNKLNRNYNQFEGAFNLKSTNAQQRVLSYWLNATYRNTQDIFPNNSKSKPYENYWNLEGEIGPNFGKYNKFIVGLKYHGASYNFKNSNQDFNHSIYEITPQYRFENKRFKAVAGIKISGRSTSALEPGDSFNSIFLKANLSYQVIKNYLRLSFDIDGWNNLNNFSSMLNQNKWIIPLDSLKSLKESSTPFFAQFKIDGKFTDKFSYKLYASYSIHQGLLQYFNFSDGYLTPFHSDHYETSLGGEFLFNSTNYVGGLKMLYRGFTDGDNGDFGINKYPSGYSPFRFEIFGEYNYRKRIFFGFNLTYYSNTTFYNILNKTDLTNITETTANFANLQLNAKYAINKNFTAFINGNNLLNSTVLYYPYYCEKGINFEAGIILKLGN